MQSPGAVYTKGWVVDFILDIAGYTTDQPLFTRRVIEPSCGDGAFLRGIVQRLCCAAKRRGELNARQLMDCVRAYDVDSEAVSKSRATVQSTLEASGMEHDSATAISERWVKQENFLLSSTSSAKWVIGNPPYIRATMVPREERESYCSALSTVSMGSDLYVGFIEKGLNALDDDGTLCYICADRWLQNRYGSRLRQFVSNGYNLDVHIRMHGVDAFEENVSAYPAITSIRKGTGDKLRYMECGSEFSPADVPPAEEWLANPNSALRSPNISGTVLSPLSGRNPVPLTLNDNAQFLEDMNARYPSLEAAGVKLGIGVASGCDDVYITENPDVVEHERLLPLFYMRDWRSGNRDRKRWMVNPWERDGSLVDLNSYPKLKGYFKAHERRLRARRVAKEHPREWYRTLDKPNHSLLGQEMLLFPDMAAKSDPVYSDGSRYPHHNCYWMLSDEWDIRSLGGLLMSDLVEGYVDAFGVKMRGSTLRFQAQYLRLIHIPRATDVDKTTMRELAEAFCSGDRERANEASRKAYGLEAEYA